jgi:predicted DNA-binding protein YlxM (UPF0122 family)
MSIKGFGLNTTKLHKNKTLQTTNQLFTLQKYLNIAELTVLKTCNATVVNQILKDEDAISFIAEQIIIGHCKYTDNRNCSLSTYLIKYAKWGINKLLTEEKRSNDRYHRLFVPYATHKRDIYKASFKKKSYNDDTVKINLDILTPVEKKYTLAYYIDGENMINIAQKYKVTKQAVSYTIKKGLRKLRKTQKA